MLNFVRRAFAFQPVADPDLSVLISTGERRARLPNRHVTGLVIVHALRHLDGLAQVIIRLADDDIFAGLVLSVERRRVQVSLFVAHLHHRGAVPGDGQGRVLAFAVALLAEILKRDIRRLPGCTRQFLARIQHIAAVVLLQIVLHDIRRVAVGRERRRVGFVLRRHGRIEILPAAGGVAVQRRLGHVQRLLVFQPVRDGLDGFAIYDIVERRRVALAQVVEVGDGALAIDDGYAARERLVEAR